MLNLEGVLILKCFTAYPQMFYLKEARELTKAPSYEGCLIVLMENRIDYRELQSVIEFSTYEEQV
jgi:hypothetical protein